MTKENKKLKNYQILLLGCLLSFLITLNSNKVVAESSKNELNIEKKKLFDKIILNRKLEGEEKTLEGSDKICNKGSTELIDYYKHGELEKIGLDDKPIKGEDKGKEYFEALLNVIKNFIGNDDSQNSKTDPNQNNSGQGQENGNGDGTRRLSRKLNFSIEKNQDDLIKYGKHIIPIIIFLVIAILSIPGWLICCFCCCCDCCCCCCCKKPGCKIPCFIFTYIFYALAVVICVYGFSQTNKVFVGLANTECSILKFFDEALEGEKKDYTPKWAGLKGINEILENLYNTIEGMKTNTYNTLEAQKLNISSFRSNFVNLMKESVEKFRDPHNNFEIRNTYLTDNNLVYSIDDYQINSQCALDLISNFGKYEEEDSQVKFKPSTSTAGAWEYEYKNISDFADSYIESAKKGFEEILNTGKTDEILQSLNSGKGTLNDLRASFDDIQSQIAQPILDYSDLIDKYGKLGSKLVFGVLALMNIALAILILLICFCSGKMCTNCCCCRCIFKFFTHLLWNLLALLMIITFLVGILFSLIGTLGYDVMNVISYAVSEDNLGPNGEGILVDKFGKDAKKYLQTCINGEGNLEKDIGLGDTQIDSFDEINEAEAKINSAKTLFEEKLIFPVYNIFKDMLDERETLKAFELSLVPKDLEYNVDDVANKYISFTRLLTEMNQAIKSHDIDESWETEGYHEDKVCDSGTDPEYPEYERPIVFSPLKCNPINRDWIAYTLDPSNEIYKRADLISVTIGEIEKHKDEYSKVLEDLKSKYYDYLYAYINALDVFGRTINSITINLRQYIGDGSNLFGFINGKFIGTNLKIILKYLKSALGTDIKTVGICLLIVGCALALSISSTILLIIVINVDIKNNQALEYKLNDGGRIIQYQ